jgi:Flp pilus assembly protein TadD
MFRRVGWVILAVVIAVAGIGIRERVAGAFGDPSPQELLSRGLEEMQAGRLDDALETVRAALRMAPDDPIGHNNAGVILNAAGQYELAMRELRVAVRLAPEYEEAHYNLAHVYLNLARRHGQGW